ncbi:MAG: hypothetical protein E2O65_04285 [Gammaproteobacteria bacterium]|nr:MAG: hypothetical protein E2O65_04285 [Gammaproteobacteria bacterium]
MQRVQSRCQIQPTSPGTDKLGRSRTPEPTSPGTDELGRSRTPEPTSPGTDELGRSRTPEPNAKFVPRPWVGD